MSDQEELLEIIRHMLSSVPAVEEKKMFGGIVFMVGGHMCLGIGKHEGELMCRIGADNYDNALKNPHIREMDFTGRPLKGFVFIGAEIWSEEEKLQPYVDMACEFVLSLPPKTPKANKNKKSK